MLTNPKLMLPFQIARITKIFRSSKHECVDEGQMQTQIAGPGDQLAQRHRSLVKASRARIRDRKGLTAGTRGGCATHQKIQAMILSAECADSHCETNASSRESPQRGRKPIGRLCAINYCFRCRLQSPSVPPRRIGTPALHLTR